MEGVYCVLLELPEIIYRYHVILPKDTIHDLDFLFFSFEKNTLRKSSKIFKNERNSEHKIIVQC